MTNYIQLTFNIPKELHKQFKMTVIYNESTMTKVLLKLIEEYINDSSKK